MCVCVSLLFYEGTKFSWGGWLLGKWKPPMLWGYFKTNPYLLSIPKKTPYKRKEASWGWWDPYAQQVSRIIQRGAFRGRLWHPWTPTCTSRKRGLVFLRHVASVEDAGARKDAEHRAEMGPVLRQSCKAPAAISTAASVRGCVCV